MYLPALGTATIHGVRTIIQLTIKQPVLVWHSTAQHNTHPYLARYDHRRRLRKPFSSCRVGLLFTGGYVKRVPWAFWAQCPRRASVPLPCHGLQPICLLLARTYSSALAPFSYQKIIILYEILSFGRQGALTTMLGWAAKINIACPLNAVNIPMPSSAGHSNSYPSQVFSPGGPWPLQLGPVQLKRHNKQDVTLFSSSSSLGVGVLRRPANILYG
ncbi:hypothetical protein B0T17DRAFT_514657 [Bombardia bombarda]|uniref:Uncharacterized protein n=1 Tax=Bombardia bombarda TaxID=252184 RepID=A0AA39XJ01_9PEZI|nr:hypothetical protein B0T17DRAFT_514657 [Bombardia bombarda]